GRLGRTARFSFAGAVIRAPRFRYARSACSMIRWRDVPSPIARMAARRFKVRSSRMLVRSAEGFTGRPAREDRCLAMRLLLWRNRVLHKLHGVGQARLVALTEANFPRIPS